MNLQLALWRILEKRKSDGKSWPNNFDDKLNGGEEGRFKMLIDCYINWLKSHSRPCFFSSLFPCRGLFIIDPEGTVKHMSINDLPVGRSVDETLRLVRAFQFVNKHGEVCPANWTPNSDTVSYKVWCTIQVQICMFKALSLVPQLMADGFVSLCTVPQLWKIRE